VFDFIAAAY